MTNSPITATTSLQLTVNGQPHTTHQGQTVAGLLAELDLAPHTVAVERNRDVVRRALHAQTLLHDLDIIEIVQFVGGGQ